MSLRHNDNFSHMTTLKRLITLKSAGIISPFKYNKMETCPADPQHHLSRSLSVVCVSLQLCSQKVEVDMDKLAAEMAAAEEAARRRAEEREREAVEQAEKAAQQAQERQQQEAASKAAAAAIATAGTTEQSNTPAPATGGPGEDKPTPMETGESPEGEGVWGGAEGGACLLSGSDACWMLHGFRLKQPIPAKRACI